MGGQHPVPFNLDKVELEAECPRCGFFNPFFIKQARLRDVIICRGCKANIQLEDHMNTVRKAERDIRRAMQQLELTMKSLGKITLRI
jgi:hypothetical protein